MDLQTLSGTSSSAIPLWTVSALRWSSMQPPLQRVEIAFFGATHGTSPVVGNLFKGRPGLDITIRITILGNIIVTAYSAHVPLHSTLLFNRPRSLAGSLNQHAA